VIITESRDSTIELPPSRRCTRERSVPLLSPTGLFDKIHARRVLLSARCYYTQWTGRNTVRSFVRSCTRGIYIPVSILDREDRIDGINTTNTSIVASYYYPLLSRRRRAYFPGKLGGANILRERGSEIHPPSLSRRIPRRNFLQEPPASSPYLFPHIRACFIKIEGCSRSRVESVLRKARSLAPGVVVFKTKSVSLARVRLRSPRGEGEGECISAFSLLVDAIARRLA